MTLTTQKHYVYRAYDVDGVLLYVGCTAQFRTRCDTHAVRSAWWPHHAVLAFQVRPDLTTARELEAEWIRRKDPVFNIHGRSVPPASARAGRDAYLAGKRDAEAARRSA